jgi:hypothetical protein
MDESCASRCREKRMYYLLSVYSGWDEGEDGGDEGEYGDEEDERGVHGTEEEERQEGNCE